MMMMIMLLTDFGLNLMIRVCSNNYILGVNLISCDVLVLQFPGLFSGGAAKKNGPSRKEVNGA